ncbi:MAG: hypothetical protein R3D58_06985 [Saprospiraceae bacterium]|nr:hypothetical protein [Lewinellaceae bacterium]
MKRLSLLLTLVVLALGSCKKDYFQEPLPSTNAQSLRKSYGPISVSEARAALTVSGGVQNRSYEYNIQDIEPIWDAAVDSKFANQDDILIVPVEPDSNRLPGGGANLIFFRNQDSTLDYRMLVHVPYPTYWDTTGHHLHTETYTGAIVIVYADGIIGEGYYFLNGNAVGTDNGEIADIIANSYTGVTDRGDCWPWNNKIKCPKFGSGFWENVGDFFSGLWQSFMSIFDGGTGGGTGPINPPITPITFGGIGWNLPTNNSGGGPGGSTNSSALSGYFNLSLFTGTERANAKLINKIKENACLTQSSETLLNKLLSDCDYPEDPEELFFELQILEQDIPNVSECVRDILIDDILTTYFSNDQNARSIVSSTLSAALCHPELWEKIANAYSQYDPSTHVNVLPGSIFECEEGTLESKDASAITTVFYSDCHSWGYQPVGPGNTYQACGVSGMYFNFLYIYMDSQNKIQVGVYTGNIHGSLYFEHPRVAFDGSQYSSGYAATYSALLYDAVETEIENERANNPPQNSIQRSQLIETFIDRLKDGMEAVGGRCTKTNNYGVGSNIYEISPTPTNCN